MSNDFIMARYEETMKAKKHLPFHVGYMPDFIVTKATEELGETEEIKAKSIIDLRVMLEKEDKLVCPKDDEYLLQYLRARKFNIKRAFQLMQSYYQVKKSYRDMYGTYDSDMLRRVFAMKGIFCLPYRDSDGCVVLVLQMSKWTPDVFSFAEGTVCATLGVLHSIEEPTTQVCGIRILMDVKEMTMKQVTSITPRLMILFSKAFRDTLPGRFKGIHIYNENAIFQYFFSIIKIFLSEKLKKRIHFHGHNEKNLQKLIPKTILPAEYGGDYPQDPAEWFKSEVENYFEKYAELVSYGYRE